MIEASLQAWLLLLAAIIGASLAGISLARLIPWNHTASRAGIPLAFGFACGPLVLGFSAVLSMALLPGGNRNSHLGSVAALLISLILIARLKRPAVHYQTASDQAPRDAWVWVLCALLAGWFVVFMIDTLCIPLVQNDSLEYATVGRHMFQLRSLSAYPAMDPEHDPSGFYGPWTHPPLYVVLIYLTYLFQGHADAPGLMRLIAPWALLVTTGLVYAIGRMTSERTGLLAALFLLSTPMLFLGADSALIDALPVLGLTILLCTIIAMDVSPKLQVLVQGLALGAALWTHSQAILLIPLGVFAILVRDGFRMSRHRLLQIGAFLGIALLAGFWPYWQNFKRIGTLISDNPAVFAMPELDWAEYFRTSRDFDSWPEKIQYGIFKGWFALEAFSLSFWMMTLGILLYLRQLKRKGLLRTLFREERIVASEEWKLIVLAVFSGYFGGIVLSALIGIDLMIKTERYLLIVMPCVALFAGWGIAHLSYQPKRLRGLILTVVVLFSVAQLSAMGIYRWKNLGLSLVQIAEPLDQKLASWPPYRAIEYLKEKTPLKALVLSLKPSDMYYTNRRMLSCLDPKLLPFYREQDPLVGWEMLRTLGVTHIYVPDYSMPPMYNSVLLTIMGRPDLAKLVFSNGGYQVYELNSAKTAASASVDNSVDLTPGPMAWIQAQKFVFGGRKRLNRFNASQRPLNPGEFSSLRFRFPLFLREWSMTAQSEVVPLPGRQISQSQVQVNGPTEYRLELELEGHAFAEIYLTHLDIHNNQVAEEALGGIALGQRYPKRLFIRRFTVDPKVSAIRVGVEHRGDTKVRIVRAMLSPVQQ